MLPSRHPFKCIVTALALGCAAPAVAQGADLDALYDRLAAADADSYEALETKIQDAWARSGSPAMDLLLRRGRDAMSEGDFDAAIEHLTALTDHAPDFAEGYFLRANAYYRAGLLGPALGDIETTLALNPRHFEAMGALAVVMEENDRLEDALRLYRMVLELNPQSRPVQDAAFRLEVALGGAAL